MKEIFFFFIVSLISSTDYIVQTSLLNCLKKSPQNCFEETKKLQYAPRSSNETKDDKMSLKHALALF